MSDPETVFKLANLDTNKEGKYLLSVYHPVPFGMGKNTFLVDDLYTEDKYLRGIRRGFPGSEETVVEFPPTFSYMLINRDQYEVISIEEAKKELAEMEKEEVPVTGITPGLPSQAYL